MRAPISLMLVSLLTVAAGCGDDGTGTDAAVDAGPSDGGVEPVVPDDYCPGAPGCADEGDGVLFVGAAAVDITPEIGPNTDIQTVDVNGNGEFDFFDGDEFEDRNGNRVFDGVWIAGFGSGRAASGVNDRQWVRAIALRYNQTTIALAAIDCIGFFWDDVERVRGMLGDLDVDYVAISATHTHEARDTMGMWGVSEAQTGIDEGYMETVRMGAARAVREAVTNLTPTHVQYASFSFRDMPGGTDRYVSDDRDPYILDDETKILRFTRVDTDATVATVINFGSHPQFIGSENQLLSSDFPNWLREGVQSGVAGPDGTMEPGVGGIAIFFNGAVGSQIGNERLMAQTWDGTVLDKWGMETARTVGAQTAYFVLNALGDGGGSVTDMTAALGFRRHSFDLTVDNTAFHVALLTPLFPTREVYNYDPELPIIPGENQFELRTEIAIVDVGRASIMMVPGEMDPSLFVGGYDGSYTPEGVDIVDLSRENPPDLAAAPAGPYLKDLMRADAEYRLLFGLTNDEIGYFVPEYDYQLADPRHGEGAPYIDEAPGEHYEETVSLGPREWPEIERRLRELLAWAP